MTNELIDTVLDLLRGNYSVQGMASGSKPSLSDVNAIDDIIDGLDTAAIGVPEIEYAIECLESCFTVEDLNEMTLERKAEIVAGDCLRDAGISEAEALGYNTDGYACMINF